MIHAARGPASGELIALPRPEVIEPLADLVAARRAGLLLLVLVVAGRRRRELRARLLPPAAPPLLGKERLLDRLHREDGRAKLARGARDLAVVRDHAEVLRRVGEPEIRAD